ncbi:hypothetical protein SEVIR_7G054800v4 [Setaria viridis]|uniref:F-box domain-containing protein n=1 Tax=Setaria viridis TaxID=4556 RepID=A0A4U6TM33_SETVI|nr:F-box protein At5g07610-like [Setaria viridis]XP_034601972.1 F-box protein At5g07610-like [Setaria viridis]XP_034601973.1 F-box protein At5g07610-like [Setaria viridis]TKW03651.1 hypothetical protein SEVIR_7G054800v2 [Setaria viridis]
MANPAAASLTDDLIVEILSRLPVKSLCRCKCVSPHWRGLISHPDHRHRLPQTLAGFFLNASNRGRQARRFINLSEASRPPLIRYPFSFMPGYDDVTIVDSCNGLLLCRASRTESSSPDAVFCHVVCNPATRSWHVLPNSSSGCVDNNNELRPARLGFDPAVSPNFHVFEFVHSEQGYGCVAGVEIYSSETGAWSYSESEWEEETHLLEGSPSVFFDGLLHFITIDFTVVAVNVKGESWWEKAVPEDSYDLQNWDFYEAWEPCFIGRYKGNLCYINEFYSDTDVSIWVLEDYAADEWILKHRVSIQRLTKNIATPAESKCYNFITVHPHCNWFLYVTGSDKILMAYDMDRDAVHVIQNLGLDCILQCIPYVPFYGN